MTTTYSGDSNVKRVTRVLFWLEAVLHVRDMYDTDFLVLSSYEGGDISCLLGLGVDPRRIVAVDIDGDSAAECRRRFPGVEIVNLDVFAYAAGTHRRFGAVLLDFCCTVSAATSKKIAKLLSDCASDKCYLGVGHMYGRERGAQRDRIRELQDHVVVGIDPEDIPTAPAIARSLECVSGIAKAGMRHKCAPMWAGCVAYQSTVPMVYTMGVVFSPKRRANTWSVKRYQRAWREASDALEAKLGDDMLIMRVRPVDDGEMRKQVLSFEDRFEGKLGKLSAKRLAMLFNLPTSTVAAWKAHKTMGTYQQQREQSA